MASFLFLEALFDLDSKYFDFGFFTTMQYF